MRNEREKENLRRQYHIHREAERKRRARCFNCSKQYMIFLIILFCLISFIMGVMAGMQIQVRNDSEVLQQEIDHSLN